MHDNGKTGKYYPKGTKAIYSNESENSCNNFSCLKLIDK